MVDLDDRFASAHVGVEAGPHVMLAVSDSGIGMDAATRARIFEPFFTTKEKGKGTGLGLSTVFGIVQQSHGTVWCYSEPGIGTTFKIYLPRSKREREVQATPAPTPDLRGSETILLVEDEEALRLVLRTALRRAGYQVLDAQNGGDALLLCEQHVGKIDLILTDMVMPRMNGVELVERLHLLRPDARSLFMSGYTENAALRHGLLSPEMAFVQKPVTPEALLQKVRQLLGEKPAR
jgi:CheY-like chemotaxis protein